MTSVSKSLAAGLRVGYLLAPEAGRSGCAPVGRMTTSLVALTWMAAPMGAAIASAWIRDGTADRIAAFKRAECLARRELAERVLGSPETPSHRASCHLWLPLPEPWRGEEFAAEARRRGVVLAPPEVFVVGRGETPHAVRLSIGTPPSRAELERGLWIVEEIVRGPREACRSIV